MRFFRYLFLASFNNLAILKQYAGKCLRISMSVCPQINYATRAAAAGLFLFRVRRRKGRHQDQKKTLSRRTDTSKGIDGWHAAQDMSHHTLEEISLLQYEVSHFCVIFREINALCHRLTGTFPPLLDRESRPKAAFPLSLSPPLKNVLGHAQLIYIR